MYSKKQIKDWIVTNLSFFKMSYESLSKFASLGKITNVLNLTSQANLGDGGFDFISALRNRDQKFNHRYLLIQNFYFTSKLGSTYYQIRLRTSQKINKVHIAFSGFDSVNLNI